MAYQTAIPTSYRHSRVSGNPAALYRHSRVSGNPERSEKTSPLPPHRRIPAYAGMTVERGGLE